MTLGRSFNLSDSQFKSFKTELDCVILKAPPALISMYKISDIYDGESLSAFFSVYLEKKLNPKRLKF